MNPDSPQLDKAAPKLWSAQRSALFLIITVGIYLGGIIIAGFFLRFQPSEDAEFSVNYETKIVTLSPVTKKWRWGIPTQSYLDQVYYTLEQSKKGSIEVQFNLPAREEVDSTSILFDQETTQKRIRVISPKTVNLWEFILRGWRAR